MVQGGQIPDVVEMPERWLSLYATNGQLESLEPWLANWEDTSQLTDRTLQFGRVVKNTAYMVPYGFYIRALFYNKKLFQEAGIAGRRRRSTSSCRPREDQRHPGKSGYCLRGSKGGFSGWYMFMATMNGKGDWFTEDGTSTFNEPGAVAGFQFLVDSTRRATRPRTA
jgi:multiple sugar transport system substrate-binding protein